MFGFQKIWKQPIPPPQRPKGITLEQRIGIQAAAEDIWQTLSDPTTWQSWSPLCTGAEGVIRFGERLKLQHTLGPLSREIHVEIIEWEPDAQIVWRDHIRAGVRSIRYYELEKLYDQGTIFCSGEIFQGPLARRWLRRHGAHYTKAIQAECDTLKALMESGTSSS